MSRVLRYSIQAFWTVLGILCALALAHLLWGWLFGRPTHSVANLISDLMLMAMGFLLAMIVWTAYFAVFRFSSSLVAPTVGIVSSIMFCVAIHGVTHILFPATPRESLATAFIWLALLFVSISGPFRFYRVTSVLISRLLFPESSCSAA